MNYIKLSPFTIVIFISLLIRLVAIGSTDLIAEEAYYWNYSHHLDFGYLDHPPMVAVLIKISTFLFGTNEFGVRFPSIVCWFVCTFFSYKLTELIKPKSGKNALLLLSILPFFFIHSLVITPDLPLIACWSASLYYLYLALVNDKMAAWYYVGIWIGFGMLSKYTIGLLGPAILLYMLCVRDARRWFLSPEPYLALLIVSVIFSPVIYWNATHDWVSFVFQSTRRLHEEDNFSLHYLLALLGLFLTPLGLLGFWLLFRANATKQVNDATLRFVKLFTLTPLSIFAVFSLMHAIKFNWIGPSLLALIPWLALVNKPKGWVVTGGALLTGYAAILACMTLGIPEVPYRLLLTKYIDWNDLSQQVYEIANKAEKELNTDIILLPLDRYNIASELSFYQAKQMALHHINHSYPVVGMDVFGYESLMYRYWRDVRSTTNQTAILVSVDKNILHRDDIVNKYTNLSPIHTFWAHNQGRGANITPYYYQIVKITA